MKADPIKYDRFHDVTSERPDDPPELRPDIHAKGPPPGSLLELRSNAAARRRRRSVIAIILIAVAALCGGATWWWLRSQTNAAQKWITATVTVDDVEDTVTALGNLQPRDYVDVGAQVSGQLMHIDVQVGQTVKTGDLLAEIDPTLAQAKVTSDEAASASLAAQLVDRQAQLDLAGKQLQRQQNLMRSDATSEDALQVAEAALRSNKAELAALRAQAKQAQSTLAADQANLGYTKIYAPMAGTVVSLTARQGQTLNASQQAPVILRIADLSTMTVWTQVSEADVPQLKIGMDAYFTTLGEQDRRWHGKLRQILPTPDVVNNVVLYHRAVRRRESDGALMTQMSAQVFFVVPRRGRDDGAGRGAEAGSGGQGARRRSVRGRRGRRRPRETTTAASIVSGASPDGRRTRSRGARSGSAS